MNIESLQKEMVIDLRKHFTDKKYKYYNKRKIEASKEIWRIALLTLDRLEMPNYSSWLTGFEDIVISPFLYHAMDKMTKD